MTVQYFRQAALFLCVVVLTLTIASPVSYALENEKEKPKTALTLPKTPDDLDLIDVGTVKEIKQPDIIVLDSGRTYHMDQIRVPVFYNENAMNYLKTAVLNKLVGIYAVKNQKIGAADRYGYPYGHVLRDDATWIQADMVARGLAWAFSTDLNRTLILPLYKFEAAARASRQGFWKDPDYAIKTKNNIAKYTNSFQIYQGVVSRTELVNDKYVITCDAGDNKAPVFSFTIKPDKSFLFAHPTAGPRFTDLMFTWRNTVVRVRGWVEKDSTFENAMPTLEVTHPEQMEFINPTTGESIER